MNSGIYAIENILNKKKYVGSAKNFKKRWYVHKYKLNHNTHDNSYLQNAWNEYGADNFKFTIIEEVEPINLIQREQYYIDLYDVCNRNIGYNLSPTVGNTLGFKFTEESKLKMSLMKKDKPSTRKNYKMTDETKKKIGESNKISQLGRTHTKETINKMKKPHGSMSEITKKKLSDWRKGLIPSEKNGQWMIIKNKKIDNTIKNRGEKNGMSITNKEEVIAIRNDYDNGLSISNLMVKYNKKYMFTYKIIKRLRWAWLDNSSLSD
jgi:group I intron endonuclease